MIDIVSFYKGECPDKFGRYIQDFWNYKGDKLRLEHDHKYIQMLFPIDSGSKFNAHAPLITKEAIEAFKESDYLKGLLVKSFDMMLDYYGFDRDGYRIFPACEMNPKNSVWLKHYDHNQLRITRIIRCLVLFGLQDLAISFYDALCREAVKYPSNFQQETLDYWFDAFSKPLDKGLT